MKTAKPMRTSVHIIAKKNRLNKESAARNGNMQVTITGVLPDCTKTELEKLGYDVYQYPIFLNISSKNIPDSTFRVRWDQLRDHFSEIYTEFDIEFI